MCVVMETDEKTDDRKLYICQEINEETTRYIVENVLRCNREDYRVDEHCLEPIIVYINTDGGSVTDSIAIGDVLSLSRTPIYTVNIGTCYSGGFYVYLAGIKRYCMPRASFLWHDGDVEYSGSVMKTRDFMEFESKKIMPMIRDYILSKTLINENLYAKKERDEWYILPDEAKDLGIITDIVGEDCSLEEIL